MRVENTVHFGNSEGDTTNDSFNEPSTIVETSPERTAVLKLIEEFESSLIKNTKNNDIDINTIQDLSIPAYFIGFTRLYYSGSSNNLCQLWLNLILKLTSNFTRLTQVLQFDKEILQILFILNFSKYEQPRKTSIDGFFKIFKLFKNNLEIENSVCANDSKELDRTVDHNYEEFLHQHIRPVIAEFYRFPKGICEFSNILEQDMTKVLSDDVNSLGIKHKYKRHTKKIHELLHCSICSEVAPIHFELYGTVIYSSKTIINFWLRVIEYSSKYPKDKKLLHSVAILYLHESGGITKTLSDWIKIEERSSNIVKILKVPFNTFKKHYPASIKFNESSHYALDMFRAALSHFYKIKCFDDFSDYFHNYVCKHADKNCLEDFQFLEFILKVLTDKNYKSAINFIKFFSSCKKLYETFLFTYPTEAFSLFTLVFLGEHGGDDHGDDDKGKNFKTKAKSDQILDFKNIEPAILQRELITLQTNIIEKFDFQKLILLSEQINCKITKSFIIDCFDKNKSCLKEIAIYLFQSGVIDSAEEFRKVLLIYLNRDDELKKKTEIEGKRVCGTTSTSKELSTATLNDSNGNLLFNFKDHQVSFIYKLFEEGCYRNFIDGVSIEFSDIVGKFAGDRQFIEGLFDLFGKMSNTENFNTFCWGLFKNWENFNSSQQPNQKLTINQLKVFVRFAQNQLLNGSDSDGEIPKSQYFDFIKKIYKDQVETNDEIKNWFNCSEMLIVNLESKLGLLSAATEKLNINNVTLTKNQEIKKESTECESATLTPTKKAPKKIPRSLRSSKRLERTPSDPSSNKKDPTNKKKNKQKPKRVLSDPSPKTMSKNKDYVDQKSLLTDDDEAIEQGIEAVETAENNENSNDNLLQVVKSEESGRDYQDQKVADSSMSTDASEISVCYEAAHISIQTSLLFNDSSDLSNLEPEANQINKEQNKENQSQISKENEKPKEFDQKTADTIGLNKKPLTSNLTPSRRFSILKDTNSTTPRRSVAFNAIHEECDVDGLVVENDVIPTDQDTRGSKRRRHIAKERKLKSQSPHSGGSETSNVELFKKIHGQDENLPINSKVIPGNSNAPQKIPPSFLSRGLSRGMAMLQAVSPMAPRLGSLSVNVQNNGNHMNSPKNQSTINQPLHGTPEVSPVARRKNKRAEVLNSHEGNASKYRKLDMGSLPNSSTSINHVNGLLCSDKETNTAKVASKDRETNTDEKESFDKSEQIEVKPEMRTKSTEVHSCEIQTKGLYQITTMIVKEFHTYYSKERLLDKLAHTYNKQQVLEIYNDMCRLCQLKRTDKFEEKNILALLEEIIKVLSAKSSTYDINQWWFKLMVTNNDFFEKG